MEGGLRRKRKWKGIGGGGGIRSEQNGERGGGRLDEGERGRKRIRWGKGGRGGGGGRKRQRRN